MKGNRFDKGTPGMIERLGRCTLYHRKINGEFFQWKIKHGFTDVVGDYAMDNIVALNNALNELKKKFKTILN